RGGDARDGENGDGGRQDARRQDGVEHRILHGAADGLPGPGITAGRSTPATSEGSRDRQRPGEARAHIPCTFQVAISTTRVPGRWAARPALRPPADSRRPPPSPTAAAAAAP